jgi:DNA-directed RNA polymerase subunit RPC12/RpoP
MGAASSLGAGYSHICARCSRWFGWSGASGRVPFASPGRVGDTTRVREAREYAPAVRGERVACPQCGFPHVDPNGNKERDVLVNGNTKGKGHWESLRAAACAIS